MLENKEGLLGGELVGGLGGTGSGRLVLFVMLGGVEDSESFGMLVSIVGSVSLDMLGEFGGSFSFVMLEDSELFSMLGRIVRSVSLDMLGEFRRSFSVAVLVLVEGSVGVCMLVRMG